jgi:hypothetical protein
MPISGKFLGETKGNKNLPPCRDAGSQGGSGDGHSGGPSAKFIGETKGNRDLPTNRSSGVDEGGYCK